ncbi:MAG: GNAT family N-acetyltransferase [Erysipelotrichaceae bacterium]|nr:GNAT family N-acetyltransferase [Erysipelotrichaceae bacterium]
MMIRQLRENERELLKDFLYEAIFVPEGVSAPERSIVDKPELAVYHEGFGSRACDNCLIAETDGKAVGAVWSRIMNDYGHIDDLTPSLAISLKREFRGKGIGTALMKEMLQLLRKQGYEKVSLSVQKVNRAVKMYERLGFKVIRESGEEYLMIRELQS